MGRFFNMDNKFFVFMGRVGDLIILNILCLVCCIPVITIGASLTSLFYVTLKMVRNEESYLVRSFFKAFRQNFRQATIMNLIFLVMSAIIYMDIAIIGQMSGIASKVFVCMFALIGTLFAMTFLYAYPVLSKFYNTIRGTLQNAILMAIRHLPYTIIMLVIAALPVAGFFMAPSAQFQATILMLMFFVGGAVVAYLNSIFLVKIFDKYIPEETAAPADETDSNE